MNENIIVITPDDTITTANYNGYNSLKEVVDGCIERFHCMELDFSLPHLEEKDVLGINFYCNEEFLISDDEQFDKVNAIASLISGQEIRGNVAMTACDGYDEEERGFQQGRETNVMEKILERYVEGNKEKIANLHKEFDGNKSEPTFEVMSYDEWKDRER